MTYPTAAVVTTNLDAGTDSPASARTDLFDAVQKLNQMIAHTSAFAATLLDDTSASAARATLAVVRLVMRFLLRQLRPQPGPCWGRLRPVPTPTLQA